MALVISILWRPTSTGRWAEIVPCRASDGSYCSSTMQALVASEAGGAGVSWMRPRGVLVCSEGYWQR